MRTPTTISAEDFKKIFAKSRRQPEGKHQQIFGQLLNGIYKPSLSQDLAFWTYSAAGEQKPLKTGVLQKRKGMQKGDFDYRFELRERFRGVNSSDVLRIIYIEFKSEAGSLTKEQKIFREKHQGLSNVACYIAKSPEEAIKILQREGVLITKERI